MRPNDGYSIEVAAFRAISAWPMATSSDNTYFVPTSPATILPG
eukprot:COSAG01_NODE_34357_length_549_cov_0.660000_1_plen_42_part_10